MFLIVGKVARESLNDFEWTSLLIEFLSLCEVYMLLDSLDRSLIVRYGINSEIDPFKK